VIPPWPLRRLIAPVWVALGALAALAAPLLEAAGRLASRLSDRPHPLAVTRLLVAYLVREAAVIVACAALWVASGFGARLATEPFQARHYALLRWFVAGVVAQARATLGLRIDLAPDPAAAAALADPERPLIVFSRHAGPGDSVLLVDMLLARFGRRPCVVMKEAVALDPVVDLVAQRLPTALLGDDDDASCASVAALARQLDGREALLLFPEGGNFSPERRLRAIRSLRRRGSHVRAARAERLAHTLAPRPGGALAALAAAPEVDVVFSAHTGLGRAARGLALLRDLPTDSTLQVRLWHAPAAERPRDRDAQVDWLDGWWRRIDDWVEATGEE
jgi:1-acyl-sn-glycerol-3-phosphate acyltransferase